MTITRIDIYEAFNLMYNFSDKEAELLNAGLELAHQPKRFSATYIEETQKPHPDICRVRNWEVLIKPKGY